MTTETLKQCPFCNGNPDCIHEGVPEGYYPWIVFCRSCYVTTPNCPTMDDAVKIWNTRA